jgi:hypothetical protein
MLARVLEDLLELDARPLEVVIVDDVRAGLNLL